MGGANGMVQRAHVMEQVSLYEVLRARHASMRELGAFGLGRDDLGITLGVAARRAGMTPERLAAAFGAAAISEEVREGAGTV